LGFIKEYLYKINFNRLRF